MSRPRVKILARLLFGYALCAVVPVKSQYTDPLGDYHLTFLQAVWRHGNRTQASPYPLRIAQATELAAPYGIGNLTPRGRSEAFQMGRFLRKRYEDFLPPYFTYTSSSLVCTEASRTQETCLTGMAGLFPPTGPQVWQDQGLGQLWTPVPCQYTPQMEDQVFTQFVDCPRMTELQLQLYDTPVYLEEIARLTDFGLVNEYVALNAGEISLNALELSCYYDLFATLDGNGEPLPNWATKVYPEPLRSLYGLYINSFSGTPELATLMTGEFWRQTLELADSLERNTLTPRDRIFNGYSVHDVNVASLISSLRPRNVARPVPPYSAVFMIEWYRSTRDPTQIALKILKSFTFVPTGTLRRKPEIRLAEFIYRYNSQQNELITLDVPGCGEVCTLDQFREVVRDLIPTQPRSEYCTGQSFLAPAELEFYRQLIEPYL